MGVPDGYTKLPEGLRCRCIKAWQEADGSRWCCGGGAMKSLTDEGVAMMDAALMRSGEYLYDIEE